MKTLSLLFLVLSFIPVLAQTEDVKTTGDISPAVIANNFSATYGVRPDAIEAILWIYEAEGYDVQRRKSATEQILKMYAQSPEKQQKSTELSPTSLSKMGIANAPKITSALEWDLFARNHYLSATGHNSPAVVAKGDVNIWYGIPPKALRALATQLEQNKTDLSNFEIKLADQVKKYGELKTELETYGAKEEIYRQAEALLEEGKFEEAEKLIESDYHASKKRQAYKGFVFGKTKELLLKYEEAAQGYKDAVFLDKGNTTYLLYYANNANTLARYDEAIKHYQIALRIDTIKAGNNKVKAKILNNLGSALDSKGEYDTAIKYYSKALEINIEAFGEWHPQVATNYNNLGLAWDSKGEYDKAIEYHRKSLEIKWAIHGEQHPDVATSYNNLGLAWKSKGEYDKAIEFYEKALEIGLVIFGDGHPNITTYYNNLGEMWHLKGFYDKAIEYFSIALEIDQAIFGERHPDVAASYNNLGRTWNFKGECDKAIGYFEKALEILLATHGERHFKVAVIYDNFGEAWYTKGNSDKAIEYFEKGLEIKWATVGERHQSITTSYNNLALAWASKGEFDKAIGYYEDALELSQAIFGDRHPYIAIYYNNLGEAWRQKEEYDKAIGYYDRALEISLAIYGDGHPNVAACYNNLGIALCAKGEHERTIGYFEKALEINLTIFGDRHPNVAACYNNFGTAWFSKGEYDKAIECFEKSQIILSQFLEPTHPNRITIATGLSDAANNKGMELINEKKYKEAVPYFQKALSNAEVTRNATFSLMCLNNVGSAHKHLKNYEQGLLHLESGLQKAEQLNQEIDQQINKELTREKLNNPEVKAKIAELKNFALIRRMKYHKVGCLNGLKRAKEAKALAKQLWQEGTEAKDTRLLEDLKNEGYDFGKN